MAYLPKRIAWRVSYVWPCGSCILGSDNPPLADLGYGTSWQHAYLERHYRVLAQTLRQAAEWLVFSYSVSKIPTAKSQD